MPVVFVTGANRGIGLEFARQYLHQGYKVFGTSRAPYSNVKELSEIISKDYHLVLDVSNADSIAKLASNFSKKDIKIDLLINNSGIFLKSDFTTKEKDMAEACMEQFKVNAMGPLLVTQSLLPFMNEGCKVINITSRMGSIEDNTSGGYYGYRMSKAALNMVTKSLAIDLMKYKIKVLALHPGYIRTDMTGGQGDMDPREAVEKMIHVIDDLSEDISGGFYHRDAIIVVADVLFRINFFRSTATIMKHVFYVLSGILTVSSLPVEIRSTQPFKLSSVSEESLRTIRNLDLPVFDTEPKFLLKEVGFEQDNISEVADILKDKMGSFKNPCSGIDSEKRKAANERCMNWVIENNYMSYGETFQNIKNKSGKKMDKGTFEEFKQMAQEIVDDVNNKNTIVQNIRGECVLRNGFTINSELIKDMVHCKSVKNRMSSIEIVYHSLVDQLEGSSEIAPPILVIGPSESEEFNEYLPFSDPKKLTVSAPRKDGTTFRIPVIQVPLIRGKNDGKVYVVDIHYDHNNPFVELNEYLELVKELNGGNPQIWAHTTSYSFTLSPFSITPLVADKLFNDILFSSSVLNENSFCDLLKSYGTQNTILNQGNLQFSSEKVIDSFYSNLFSNDNILFRERREDFINFFRYIDEKLPRFAQCVNKWLKQVKKPLDQYVLSVSFNDDINDDRLYMGMSFKARDSLFTKSVMDQLKSDCDPNETFFVSESELLQKDTLLPKIVQQSVGHEVQQKKGVKHPLGNCAEDQSCSLAVTNGDTMSSVKSKSLMVRSYRYYGDHNRRYITPVERCGNCMLYRSFDRKESSSSSSNQVKIEKQDISVMGIAFTDLVSIEMRKVLGHSTLLGLDGKAERSTLARAQLMTTVRRIKTFLKNDNTYMAARKQEDIIIEHFLEKTKTNEKEEKKDK